MTKYLFKLVLIYLSLFENHTNNYECISYPTTLTPFGKFFKKLDLPNLRIIFSLTSVKSTTSLSFFEDTSDIDLFSFMFFNL